MNITVIKLGGSLMHSQVLLNWLESIQRFALNNNVVVVPGGGVFADRVREVQQQFLFDEQMAHRMALLAMCQYGQMLSGLNSHFQMIEDLGQFPSSFDQKLPLIWLPNDMINDLSEIPANWDFTSDSIALWLAIRCNADRLVLVKSPNVNSKQLNINELMEQGMVDKGIQRLIEQYSGKLLWLSKSQFNVLNDTESLSDSSLEISY